MNTATSQLFTEAQAWADDDPHPGTRAALVELLASAKAGDDGALHELEDAFSGTLQFGTAGLRGTMGPGPNRMNISVVSRAAAGIGAYLSEKVGDARIVIGYDARYNSQDFALASAEILVASGHAVTLLPEQWPTPVLAYAVRKLDADCGIMVTASHNPAADNGYKVYLGARATSEEGRGVQIVPPADSEIATKIAQVGPVKEIARATSGWDFAPRDFQTDYVRSIAQIVETTLETEPKDLTIVHSAMHGVGNSTMLKAFAQAGFTDIHSVPEQAQPDPDFPTVPFPNPEEKGAIDLSLKLAEKVNADLVIANDPDADRCAAAIFDPRAQCWRMLHGDELGLLLATYLLRYRTIKGTVANSIVSSRALLSLAQAHGNSSVQTLTGFKWIARAENLSFGYEEAIGYCVLPDVVRDKDGISAALAIAQLAAIRKSQGSSLYELLDELARVHGLFLTDQLSIRVKDLSKISDMMTRLRTAPPESLNGSPVRVQDLSKGTPETTGLPPTDAVVLLADDSSRVIVRPSGTEPKLKAYLEVVHPVGSEASFDELTAARARARAALENLKEQTRKALGA